MKIFVSFLFSCFCLLSGVAHAGGGCPGGQMGVYLDSAPSSAGYTTFTLTALSTGKRYHFTGGFAKQGDGICLPSTGQYVVYWDKVGKTCEGTFQQAGACALTISNDRKTLSGKYASMEGSRAPLNGTPCCR